MNYFSIHNHTHYSNIRLLDSINRPKELIEYALELGLKGLAITDHECLSSHVEVNKWMLDNQEKYPDFKIGLGNEIYLCDTRDSGQKYYHLVLIAKDEVGHKQLRELSSIAWYNSYNDRGMTRVPLLKSELAAKISSNPGHLIATTACLGGEVSHLTLEMIKMENAKLNTMAIKQKIHDFMTGMKNLFGEDFYVECAPGLHADQIAVNARLRAIAAAYQVKMVFGTDSHYLNQDQRPIHKAYLNSKEGDREVDDFYTYSYMMKSDEVREVLFQSIYDKDFIESMFKNSLEIADKISHYDLHKEQKIPLVDVSDKNFIPDESIRVHLRGYAHLYQLFNTGDEQEQYWVRDCVSQLFRKGKLNSKYLKRLDEETDVCSYLSENLGQPLVGYFNTLQHYIDTFWENGSIVGPGRGSAVGFLSNYLQGITQIDPIEWDLPYWRFLNKDRVELPKLSILGSIK